MATQTETELIGVENYLVTNPEHTVLLSVSGDSMIEAGLYEGDMLVVDTQKKEQLGDIVIALVDGEYTVKYLAKDDKKNWFLQPANPNYDAIYPSSTLEIYGVVAGSFRKY
jgi:repressor LexA